VLRECLVYSSMRLGSPFIAPRQLGAVESIPGRQFLPSVAWRTGQSGAPPDTVRCGFLSYFGAADRWRFRAVGAPDTVRCTPDSPVPPSDHWLCHASRADYATDRWPDRLLAYRTVRCTTGQSDDLSRTPPTKPESSQFARAILAHQTLSSAPPDSPVHPDCAESWLLSQVFSKLVFSYF
jgi:hypothetical protein